MIDAVDVDAHQRGGLRVLRDRTDAAAEAGAVHEGSRATIMTRRRR